jgi:hypothetical protein
VGQQSQTVGVHQDRFVGVQHVTEPAECLPIRSHARPDHPGLYPARLDHTIRRGDTVIATGTMTAACVRKVPPPMTSIEIPADVRERLCTHT